jgi:predicted MFS family arabinose efflux permease
MAGVAMFALSHVNAGWQIIAVFFVVGATGLQGGGGSLFMSVPLANWFVRKRGQAISIAFIGMPAGIFVFSPISQLLIDEVGWRQTWVILGGGGALITVLVALLIMRRRPQDMGLNPDGIAAPPAGIGTPAHQTSLHAAEDSWTRQEAVRSATFWRRVTYFIDDKGFDAHIVAWSLSAEALAAFLVSLPTGWAMDRYPPRYVATVSTLLMVAGFILTMTAGSVLQVFAATSVFGLGVASFIICQNAVWPAYFGHANIGAIRGLATPLMLAFSAIGAPATGLVRDSTGSFVYPWIVGTVCLLVAAILLLSTSRPQRGSQTTAAEVEPAGVT